MIIGHTKQISQLQEQIANNRLFHAYLFVGENHIGKTSIAREISHEIQEDNYNLDHTEILGRTESIKIKEIKALIEKINLTNQGKYKTIIVQNIERMTIPAANSFLKTLEEPPKNTVFFLTTENISSILPTITSRVRILNFKKLEQKEIEEGMNKLKLIPPTEVEYYGKIGLAINLAKNEGLKNTYTTTKNKAEELLKEKNVVARFSYINELISNKEQDNTSIFLEQLENIVRKELINQSAKPAETIKRLSKIEETGILLKQNINARLALENLMLEI